MKNFDFCKREMIYGVPLNEQQLTESLRLKNIYDGIEYELDEANHRITFFYYRISYPYSYSVTPYGGAFLLRLQNPNMTAFSVNDRTAIDINSFFIRTCGAVTLDYDNYYEKKGAEL